LYTTVIHICFGHVLRVLNYNIWSLHSQNMLNSLIATPLH